MSPARSLSRQASSQTTAERGWGQVTGPPLQAPPSDQVTGAASSGTYRPVTWQVPGQARLLIDHGWEGLGLGIVLPEDLQLTEISRPVLETKMSVSPTQTPGTKYCAWAVTGRSYS